MYVVIPMLHTSQRAASLEEGRGQPERAGPPGTKAWEKRDEVFIVLFDYSVGMIEKGETGVCALRVVVAIQS